MNTLVYVGPPNRGMSFYLPEEDLAAVPEGAILHPMRGYTIHLAVFDAARRPLGSVKVAALGYASAREWIDATGYVYDWGGWR